MNRSYFFKNRKRMVLSVLPFVVAMLGAGAILPSGWSSSSPSLTATGTMPDFPPSYLPVRYTSVSDITRRDTVEAGQVFIQQLPDSLGGKAIASYSADRLPLNSWLLERSFFWATSQDDRGVHRFALQAWPSPFTDSAASIPWTLDVVVQ